ncbi:hypothetical protein I2486_09240 [Cellulophaga sp. E16_2]|uniref:Uncharacterized protein n=1 Tax=Cellulophaga algicola (strain DSM 14237 / IC166 / ACAM 630) TaxID=688270 RepID=E6XE64_CELAD|nr:MULTISPECIES: hypothetical protein [Cellulophaga]ADV49145.1 hypothetical protein Celal_1845 [Cellulophaga algicola DSM 14237]MBO0591593.1 hypothetical protein [Cellulophaga sp. E16_2]
MVNSSLKRRIISELENLISQSCPNRKIEKKHNDLHIALLKKHYNASEVAIDYYRRRITLNVVIDDTVYDPKKINTYLPTFRADLHFVSLKYFLKDCLEKDTRSIAFYASLLRTYAMKDSSLQVN